MFPGNVITGAQDLIGGSRGHSAVFPYWLPEWFVKLLTDKGDVVLDPFAGRGTTLLAALDLGRKAVGIEKDPRHAETCRENLEKRLVRGMSSRAILGPVKPEAYPGKMKKTPVRLKTS